MIIAQFKDSDKSDKKSSVGKKIGGVALLGGSAAIGTQSIRSGLPRVLGVRLEQHGTSRKAAANIIKEGYLDPGYGGSEGGVTKSMRLPKDFLERSKGYVFVSGKNANHPNWDKRNNLSSIGDVLTRKIQVLGYRGSKAGTITDKNIENGSKFVGTLADVIKDQLFGKEETYDVFTKRIKKDGYVPYKFKGGYTSSRVMDAANITDNDLKKAYKVYKQNRNYRGKFLDDMKVSGFKDPKRIKRIKTLQKKYKSIYDSFSENEKKYFKQEVVNQRNSIGKEYWNADSFNNNLSKYDLPDNPVLEKKIRRLGNLSSEIGRQVENQTLVKNLGLNAAWTDKLVKSPPFGAVGVGKTLYIPGTDKYFNDVDRFKFDQDDPFFGLGKGNAIKTKEKVRAFGNRFSAAKYLLEKEGNGNYFKGASKLMGANKGRVLAGLGILGVGGTAAGLLGAKGIKLLKSDKPRNKRSKVKSYVRKGKLVQTFERLNPFYNKDKQGK
jgi:hypothetical protein